MPDTREKSRATVVFHYPPGSMPDTSLGDQPTGLPRVDYFRAKTTAGDDAYVAASDDLRIIVRYVMDHADKIPQGMGVSVAHVSSIDGDLVNLASAISIKPQGSTEANGTFETVISMADDLEDVRVGDSIATSETDSGTEPADELDRDVWFENDADTSDTDTIVDSTDSTEDTPTDVADADGDTGVLDSADEAEGEDTADTAPAEGETPGASDEAAQDEAAGHSDTADTADTASASEEAQPDSEETTDREVVVTHLVNQVVPERVEGDAAAPLSAGVDRDLSAFPAHARVLIDSLIRQANTLYESNCAEARADVGYLTSQDVEDEKAALVRSLLTEPTSTVTAYLDAITQRDSLVMAIQNDLDRVRDEFQRREDDWVEQKIKVVMPQLRRMFRENYPTTEEQVSQEVIETAQPEVDSADARVTEAENQARADVALRLHHQGERGRQLSQLMRLADVRARMEADLDSAVQSALDAYQEEMDAAEKQFAAADVVDSEAGAPALTDDTATFEQVGDAPLETDGPVSRKVDLSELIDSEAEGDAAAQGDDALAPEASEDNYPTATFYAVTPPEDGEELVDSEDENTAQGGDNHPTNGDGHATGGDSSTLFTQTSQESTASKPSPELTQAPNTDPETGEDLDFFDDLFDESEDTSHEHDTPGPRKGFRRLFGRFGRNG